VVGASTSDTTPPSTPTGVYVVTTSPSTVDLYWSASTDNVAVVGYKVYYQNGVFIGDTGGAFFQTTMRNLSPSYTYTVAAYDGAGNISAQSSPTSATSSSLMYQRSSLASILASLSEMLSVLQRLLQ
jgi:chitodextrinase